MPNASDNCLPFSLQAIIWCRSVCPCAATARWQCLDSQPTFSNTQSHLLLFPQSVTQQGPRALAGTHQPSQTSTIYNNPSHQPIDPPSNVWLAAMPSISWPVHRQLLSVHRSGAHQ